MQPATSPLSRGVALDDHARFLPALLFSDPVYSASGNGALISLGSSRGGCNPGKQVWKWWWKILQMLYLESYSGVSYVVPNDLYMILAMLFLFKSEFALPKKMSLGKAGNKIVEYAVQPFSPTFLVYMHSDWKSDGFPELLFSSPPVYLWLPFPLPTYIKSLFYGWNSTVISDDRDTF